MSESPYDAYPYPEPGRYPPDQIKNLRIDTAPRRETWAEWFPGEEPSPKKVLVIGCGVYEAIAVAAQERLLRVVGVDASSKVIEIGRSTAAKAGVTNLHLEALEFGIDPMAGVFDVVCANGVLHHVRKPQHFLHQVGQVTNPGGQFVVMVYGDQYRGFVPDFCDVLRELGVERNAEGIAFVRESIARLPDHHPVKTFYAGVTDYDAQIADLWLHPYFRQYGAHELVELVENITHFKFLRWLNPATDCSVLDGAPAKIADRFGLLSPPTQYRIGQILNHADLKLSAVFKKAA